MADIPGLIPGASEGAGLGIRFLKHLTRTRLLLHLVDMLPPDGSDPAEAVAGIAAELESFSATLAGRERWLVLNKVDLLPDDEREQRCQAVIDQLQWQGPVYQVAAISGDGTRTLIGDIMTNLEERWAAEAADPELAIRERELQETMQSEARTRIQELAETRRANWQALREERAGRDDDDDHDVEVEYAPY
jgi:GTP-binding protein